MMTKENYQAEGLNIDPQPNEVWTLCIKYPNYLISNYGRIYSFYRNRIIKPSPVGDNKVYLGVMLSKDKIHTNERLHRLVAEAFIPNPQDKPQVHHIDGNSFNNRADNLMWVTHEEHLAIHARMKGGERIA